MMKLSTKVLYIASCGERWPYTSALNIFCLLSQEAKLQCESHVPFGGKKTVLACLVLDQLASHG